MELLFSAFFRLISWSLICLLTLVLNLFLLHFISIHPCDWPCPDSKDDKWLRVMVLTDVHLLGKRKGHPVDQFVREWEMSIAFQTAVKLRQPEMIIFLGDLLDEGLTVDQEDFNKYVERFNRTFPMTEETKKIFIVGNHDIGFHDRVAAYPILRKRWEKAFNSSLADIMTVKGIKFITINSMAIEGDGLDLVRETKENLLRVEDKLKKSDLLGRPVMLQHFPLYRKNDDICHEIDSQKGIDRLHKFNPGVECLSYKVSEMLLKKFNPRLVLNGHIHAGCVVNHTKYDAEEWTVASFNWRNRLDPNYLVLCISPDSYAIRKCFLPSEINIVFTSLICLIFFYFSSKFRKCFMNSIASQQKTKVKPKSGGSNENLIETKKFNEHLSKKLKKT
ncbi:metallophosphoesterase 1-like [Tetranychus urticae]|uniref:Calcineurin-like phosphoesterase domain-containing protein n=1 Tax=Tetranychus urticae TaxID=32264 RepID=T1JTZ0_TETUR|nr:metallophosphoesterase 1-like [Tetranychus urticae]